MLSEALQRNAKRETQTFKHLWVCLGVPSKDHQRFFASLRMTPRNVGSAKRRGVQTAAAHLYQMHATARKPSLLGRVQIIALDVENSVPAGAIIFERDLRAQLHQLFFGEFLSQARVQIVRDICRRISHRVSQLDHEEFGVIE